MSIRPVLACVLGIALGCGWCRAGRREIPPDRFRRQLSVPAVFDLVQEFQQGQQGRQHRLPVQGQRRRHPGFHQQDGRFRRQRRGHEAARRWPRSPGGVQLLPMTAGEIVLAYNLPGNPKELKLPRDVYPAIFLGKITNWNDPKIAAANPGVKLPDLPITVVRRADSSGTTYVFTKPSERDQPGVARQGPGTGNTVQLAEQRQDRRRAEERRRDRDDQADAGRDRLYRVRLRQADQGADGQLLQNKAGNYVAAGRRGRRSDAGQRRSSRRT